MVPAHQIVVSAVEVRVFDQSKHGEALNWQPLIRLQGAPVEAAIAATQVADSSVCTMCGNNHMDTSDMHRVEFWQDATHHQVVYIDEDDGEVSTDTDAKDFGVKPGCQQYLGGDSRSYWQNLLHQTRLQRQNRKRQTPDLQD